MFIIKNLIIMKSQGQIRQRMNIQNFLNLVIEEIDNQFENIFEIIVVHYDEKRDKELNKKMIKKMSKISVLKILQTFKILRSYEKQQK